MSSYWETQYTDGFFNVSSENGFLPIKDPLRVLPEEYSLLQDTIDKLHVFKNYTKDNDTNNNTIENKGILGIPDEIVSKVKTIPDYSELIYLETDPFILQALYRAYAFITSGFTLEKSYQEFLKSGNYGEARQLLPKNIAIPFVLVSKKIECYPWMDYHYGYSLGNYVKKIY